MPLPSCATAKAVERWMERRWWVGVQLVLVQKILVQLNWSDPVLFQAASFCGCGPSKQELWFTPCPD